jgi:leucyl-tRNA synthetase
MSNYDYKPAQIEGKWQAWWEENKIYSVTNDIELLRDKPKAYILDMFPYPSGAGLHVGHPKSYTASDVISRLRRMQGYHVLHAMGWDAFGLPAERAADRENIHPAEVTKRNISNIRSQMKRIGFSYDWTREINTSSPEYYKWTQWIFLKLYEKGLAFLEDVPVNWCPALGTVLANEEVQDGKYVETGDPVERRLMRQWMLKITEYAERLLADLDELEWPDYLKEMQRNWIGKSYGAFIDFQLNDLSFRVFTTRPDTVFGATYCVLAPEHPLIDQIVTPARKRGVDAYVQQSQQLSDLQRLSQQDEMTGVFTGANAINPVNGQMMPVWVADYVLMSYGTGAIMGVPAHDERDHKFAKLFNLPIIEVVQGGEVSVQEQAYTGEGTCINSDFLNGLFTDQAKQKIIQWLEDAESGEGTVQYRLRDWLFSRQRYWGEPFPIVHLEDGTMMPIAADNLPVELPDFVKEDLVADGQPPLARAGDDWLMVTLPDGRTGIRETNTMPQWAGSCWYYLRYIDPHNNEQAWRPELEHYWMPVDIYIGGVEHAVLHLLYARFWHKVLYDCELVSTREPFARLFNQGMVLSNSYRDANGKYYYPRQVEEVRGEWLVKEDGTPVQTQVEKMSKSRLNVFSVDDVIDEYGADALRLYELFIGPLSASGPWQMNGIEGVYRFLERVWRLVVDEETGELNPRLVPDAGSTVPDLWRLLHKTIKSITETIESIDKMNTAVSRLMIFSNEAAQSEELPIETIKTFLRILSPFAPHISEELWHRLGEDSSIVNAEWPEFDVALVKDEVVQIALQVNGRVRSVIEVAADLSEDEIRQIALSDEKISKFIGQKSIQRVIIVPGQVVNIVVSE